MFKFNKNALKAAVVLCLALVLLASALPALRGLFFTVFKAPLKLFSLLGRELHGLVFYHRNYIQNERLRQENGLLQQKINSLNETYLENARLKEMLYLKQEAPYKVSAARVISRPIDSWSQAVVIDKGSFNGIRVAMPVINSQGLVGRVIETTRSTSKVLLISDPGLGVSAVIQRSRQEGLVCGALGGYLIMRYLAEASDIRPQDAVVTSGLSQNYPKGLLIGTVVDISRESGLGIYARIRPAASLSNIEEVLVIVQ